MSERALQHRAELLSSLLKVEAFQTLEEVLRAKERRMAEELLQTLLTSEEPKPLIDYYRGYVEGMRYATAIPHGAQRRLQDGTEEQEEIEVTDGWSSWAR